MGTMRVLWRKFVLLAKQEASGIAVINLVLAIVAFAKDLLQAVYFGTSSSADALTLAFFVPDTIGNNLVGCALGVACVPMFCKLLIQGDRERLRRVFVQITIFSALCTGAICLLIYLFPDALLRVLGSGLDPVVFRQCKRLLLLLLPSMMLFPLWMIGSAALQAMGKFKPPAWAPVVFNAFSVAALVVLCLLHVEQERGAWWASIGLLVGVLGEVALVAWAFWQQGGQAWLVGGRSLRESHADVKRVVRTFSPYLVILLCSQLIYTVERSVASTLGNGTIAGLNYAFRLASMPNWVFVGALSTVFLPALSRAIAEGAMQDVRQSWNRIVRVTLLLTVPMSAVLFLFRVPIVRLLFQHGSFDEHSLHTTADILAGYSLAIVPLALTAVGVRFYMAKERMLIPMLLAMLSLFVNVWFDVHLASRIGASALGDGAAVGAWVGALTMMGFVTGELSKMGKMGDFDGALSNRNTGLQ